MIKSEYSGGESVPSKDQTACRYQKRLKAGRERNRDNQSQVACYPQAHAIECGDEGHEYFMLVLNYCYQRLKEVALSPTTSTTSPAKDKESKQFCFTDLELDSDGEDEDEANGGNANESSHPKRRCEPPQRPAEPTSLWKIWLTSKMRLRHT
jgi:hypothetical protein